MKDIQREVKALEIALEVATDIQGKPYAYAVARIQEALLGGNVVEVATENSGDGIWHAFYESLCSGKELVLITPEGARSAYRLPVYVSFGDLKEFIAAMSSSSIPVQKTWKVFMPDSGAVYLRNSMMEIALGAIPKDTLRRQTLDQLKIYLT